MIADRPITQHGLSGLPTSHPRTAGTATGIRQIKDKRYWQAQLQVKMNEITKEIERLMNEEQLLSREKSAKRSIERRVKESAKELTSKFFTKIIPNLTKTCNNNYRPHS